MHKEIDTNNLLLAVIFSALGVVVPMLFHLLGVGSTFLPMFLPLAVGSFLLTPANALIMGLVTPLVSALLTGMPPFYPPVAFMMMAELSFFCVVISVLVHRTGLNVMAVLTVAVVLERALLVLMYMYVMPLFNISVKAFTAYELAKGLPGILLMYFLVPILVPRAKKIIEKNSLHFYEDSKEVENE